MIFPLLIRIMIMGDFMKSFIRTMLLGATVCYFYIILGEYFTSIVEKYNIKVNLVIFIAFNFVYLMVFKYVFLFFKKILDE